MKYIKKQIKINKMTLKLLDLIHKKTINNLQVFLNVKIKLRLL